MQCVKKQIKWHTQFLFSFVYMRLASSRLPTLIPYLGVALLRVALSRGWGLWWRMLWISSLIGRGNSLLLWSLKSKPTSRIYISSTPTVRIRLCLTTFRRQYTRVFLASVAFVRLYWDCNLPKLQTIHGYAWNEDQRSAAQSDGFRFWLSFLICIRVRLSIWTCSGLKGGLTMPGSLSRSSSCTLAWVCMQAQTLQQIRVV